MNRLLRSFFIVVLCFSVSLIAFDAFSKTKEGKVKISSDASGSTPPGWQHGKKTGWGGGKYPPGWSKWNKEKQVRWDRDRNLAHDEVERNLLVYKMPTVKRDEIQQALDEAIVGGMMINDAKNKLVDAIKDEKKRKLLMINTAQTVLEFLK